MSLFNLIPTPVKAGIAIVAAVALTSFYLQHRAAIYRDGYEDATAAIEHQLDLQEAANREAMRLAGNEYLKSVDRLVLEKELLNEELAALSLEAAADPDADQCGIGAGSVLRLNSIR